MARRGIRYYGGIVAVLATLQAAPAPGCPGPAADSEPVAVVGESAPSRNDMPPAEGPGAQGRRWLDNRFVYEFSPQVAADPGKVAAFETACEQLLGTAALRCTHRRVAPDAADYVHVIEGGHDFSHIGRQGGCQVLSILTWHNPLVVAHEIKHALGWAHEQQHPDRDRFIEVRFDAIPPRHHAEFRVRDLGNEGPYDFDSIMHFFPSDFAKPGAVAFRPRAGVVATAYPGQRDHLSPTDLEEIRKFYGAAPGQ